MLGRAAPDVVTGRWAGLAGVIAGLAGLGIAGLVAGRIAPGGSPVTAVGELIIALLPAPLVNFGKEVLGFADKPILLGMIVLGVLALCGLAGRLEHRRRFAGAAVFGLVAVLGLIAISAQPGVQPTAYVPTIVGLLLGYLILHTLITKLHRWRTRRAAHDSGVVSADRRSFLAWTLVVSTAATVAAVGGQPPTAASPAVPSAR